MEIYKIAIPLADDKLSEHFGHCQIFEITEVDKEAGAVISSKQLAPPPHEPGVLPKWLISNGVNVIIAGGIGQRAKDLLEQKGIKVITGAPQDSPAKLVQSWLDGSLVCSDNVCDH